MPVTAEPLTTVKWPMTESSALSAIMGPRTNQEWGKTESNRSLEYNGQSGWTKRRYSAIFLVSRRLETYQAIFPTPRNPTGSHLHSFRLPGSHLPLPEDSTTPPPNFLSFRDLSVGSSHLLNTLPAFQNSPTAWILVFTSEVLSPLPLHFPITLLPILDSTFPHSLHPLFEPTSCHT